MKRLLALFLVIIMAFVLTGCPLSSGTSDSSEDSTEGSAADTSEETTTAAVESTDTSDTTTNIERSELDGVYENENGMIVVRNVQIGSCSFIVDLNEDIGTGYLSGIAERDDHALTYYDSGFGFTMVIDGDTLTVTEDGTNPYTDDGVSFDGTYTRSSTDPYDIEVDDERAYGSSYDLPSSVSDIVVNGETVSMYIDPDGRFSATFPGIFYGAPSSLQPDDGVYLVGDAGNATITIGAEGSGSSQTAEEFIAYITGQYQGSTATQLESGLILFDYSFTDGTGVSRREIIYFYLAKTEIYKVDFVFVSSDYDYYKTLTSQIDIAVN